MYAITNNGYRAISSTADLQAGETAVDVVPQTLLDSLQAAQDAMDSNNATLRTRAEAAFTDLRAYRDLASPTGAQTVAAVKLLCRVAIGLLRLQLRQLDGTE